MSKQAYTVTFLFNEVFDEVALKTKCKPSWQKGKLNGIGGKVEPGEDVNVANSREFNEEAELAVNPTFKLFCYMHGTNNDGGEFEIYFFYGKCSRYDLANIKTKEADEPIGVYNVGAICAGDWKTIGNVPWLVAAARDFGQGVFPPTFLHVEYRGDDKTGTTQ